MSFRRAALIAGGALLVVYIATLAPSVTFWDAGEFIAAAHALGIPHPPGTPLFIVLLNAWAHALWFLPFATATNLFSAVCTAAALGLVALWIARATGEPLLGLAAAGTAGAMSSVWLNATETEVYAASLCLAVCAIATADLAGRSREPRWYVATAYLLALSIPLHLSALVAAPVVVYLAAHRSDGAVDWSTGAMLAGVAVLVAGLSRLSAAIVILGVVVAAAGAMLQGGMAIRPRRRRVRQAIAVLLVAAVAFSALAILVVRARHDPAINQANPATMRDLAYVVARRQYDVSGLWPRQAPFWLQIANWFEYADWQFALVFAPTVIPSVARTAVTALFALLGVIGAVWHRQADRRTWRAVLLLFLCGTLGVVVYVNLKAGASFAWQFVPDAARHEARDRDYFFVLGFLAWGIWAGMGAMAVAARFRAPAATGLGLAALPLVLNWSEVTRRREPEASMPRMLAASLLDPLPGRAVLFVAGDNDTYPLWFAQQVEGRRRDVTIVTLPLLGAPWYVAELGRREGFTGIDRARGDIGAQVAAKARAAGRPVAVALTVPKEDRDRLGAQWVVDGLAAVDSRGLPLTGDLDSSWSMIPVARGPTENLARAIERWRAGRVVRPAIDPVHDYFQAVLSCPRLVLARRPPEAQIASLDSLCNLR